MRKQTMKTMTHGSNHYNLLI